MLLFAIYCIICAQDGATKTFHLYEPTKSEVQQYFIISITRDIEDYP